VLRLTLTDPTLANFTIIATAEFAGGNSMEPTPFDRQPLSIALCTPSACSGVPSSDYPHPFRRHEVQLSFRFLS
jgi:hypothetical protein